MLLFYWIILLDDPINLYLSLQDFYLLSSYLFPCWRLIYLLCFVFISSAALITLPIILTLVSLQCYANFYLLLHYSYKMLSLFIHFIVSVLYLFFSLYLITSSSCYCFCFILSLFLILFILIQLNSVIIYAIMLAWIIILQSFLSIFILLLAASTLFFDLV